MFRISLDGISDVNNKLQLLDKELFEITERLNTLQKTENEACRFIVGRLTEELLSERRAIMELGITLDHIGNIYKTSDEKLFEMLEETGVRKHRNAAWIELTFSRESRKLIQMITL